MLSITFTNYTFSHHSFWNSNLPLKQLRVSRGQSEQRMRRGRVWVDIENISKSKVRRLHHLSVWWKHSIGDRICEKKKTETQSKSNQIKKTHHNEKKSLGMSWLDDPPISPIDLIKSGKMELTRITSLPLHPTNWSFRSIDNSLFGKWIIASISNSKYSLQSTDGSCVQNRVSHLPQSISCHHCNWSHLRLEVRYSLQSSWISLLT